MENKIAVLGAGGWGTALARLLANKHGEAILWAYESETAKSINENHVNSEFLPGIKLPEKLKASNNLVEVIKGANIIVSVVPTQVLRSVWNKAQEHLNPNAIVVSCSKGFEESTQKLPSEILAECLPDHPVSQRVYLSGPSFAREVGKDLPTSVTIAGTDKEIAQKIQDIFRTETFLTFTHDDVIGVEVGGAVKNVIAIATGTSDGLGYGRNTRAAIITRGLYEITKIGLAKGASPYTFMGLAGIGDLVLTATDEQSRNYTVGKRLGSGEKIDKILGSVKTVAEGYKTSVALNSFIKTHDISAPICVTVYKMLHESLSPVKAAKGLCKLVLTDELGAILN